MPSFLSDAEIQAFRARLCEEAERQFLRSGVEAVSMRSLTKALGCSATTPYRYFKNKDEILAAVRVAILDRICDRLEALKCDDGRAWARAHMKAFVDFAFDEPGSYRLVFDLYQSDENEYPELVRANARALRGNYAYVERLVEQGYLKGDPEELGYIFFAELHGMLVLRMTGRPMCTREEFDRKCQRYFHLISLGPRLQAAHAGPGDLGGAPAPREKTALAQTSQKTRTAVAAATGRKTTPKTASRKRT